MALSQEERKIAEYGAKNGKTPEQIQKAIASYRLDNPPQTQSQQPSMFNRVSNTIQSAGEKVQQNISGEGEYATQSPLRRGFQATAEAFGAIPKVALDVAPSPVRTGVEKVGEFIGKGFTALTNKIGDIPQLQDWVMKHPEAAKSLEEIAGTTSAGGEISGTILGAEGGVSTLKKGANLTKKLIPTSEESIKAFSNLKKIIPDGSIATDILPNKRGIINTEITKAFDLTQGDVKNIYRSTGNQVGDFVAERNLIGQNLEDTISKIDNHYNTNYTKVRDEISKVTKSYKQTDIPRYKDALTQIKKVTDGVVGLEDVNKELNTLLKKKTLTLSDAQRVKELMDDNLNLYKVTGDVQSGVTKEGLSNLRNEIKTFIEKEVEKNTGANIAQLNNEVATSKTILNAIEDRITRGSTRATITAGDVVTFLTGSGFGTPVGGVIAVLGKKLYQSPSFKLKFTKWLNSKSQTELSNIAKQLQSGKIPAGIKVIEKSTKK